MNFENRFTNRAVGDLLLGLPSQLALTSYTVMDQGQDMQFYFVQDDYRISPKLTANVGLRYEYATPPRRKGQPVLELRSGDRHDDLCRRTASMFERALIHPDRNNFAPRIGFAYTPWTKMVVRGGYGVFYTHTVRQGREGLLGFNPPYLVDNLLQTSVSGAAAVASAAPFRLVDGYPSGLLDPNALTPTVLRRAQDANQRTPYIQQFNIGMQYELRPDVVLDVAYVGNKGTKLNGFRNLNQRAVITNPDGSQSAGARPYPAFGDIQWMENRVASNYNSLQMRLEKRFSKGLTRHGQLHLGRGARPTRRITSRRAAAARASTPACSASRRTATICAPNVDRRSSTSGTVSSPATSGNCRSAAAGASATVGTGRWISRSAAGSSPASTCCRAASR